MPPSRPSTPFALIRHRRRRPAGRRGVAAGGARSTTFTQRDPEEGKPVSEATELRIAYDDDALYVAARMHDREPARIARQLARRDQSAEADSFTLLLDPHHDHLTGAAFAVSAAGVQTRFDDLQRLLDRRLVGRGVGIGGEDRRHADGPPRCGFRIRSCGFPDPPQLTFGINAMRYIQRKKEEAWLVPGAEDRKRHGVADGASRRARRRHPAPHRGAGAVSGEPRRIRRTGRRRSVQRRRSCLRERRARLEVSGQQQPVARRHDQSRLRPGRSRSGGGQPDRVRDVLRGEAPVLHRGGEHLQQLRPRRRERLLGLQSLRADAVLFAADRAAAAGQRQRRLRRAAERHRRSWARRS